MDLGLDVALDRAVGFDVRVPRPVDDLPHRLRGGVADDGREVVVAGHDFGADEVLAGFELLHQVGRVERRVGGAPLDPLPEHC